jgi:hypothetical protein
MLWAVQWQVVVSAIVCRGCGQRRPQLKVTSHSCFNEMKIGLADKACDGRDSQLL